MVTYICELAAYLHSAWQHIYIQQQIHQKKISKKTPPASQPTSQKPNYSLMIILVPSAFLTILANSIICIKSKEAFSRTTVRPTKVFHTHFGLPIYGYNNNIKKI